MRKQPKQGRSRELVNILLQATEKAVCLYGLEGVTTPKIAEISGVSVGSIYQYFEDKQSMLECLLEQKSHVIGVQLKELLTQHAQADLITLIRLSIQFGFDTLNKNQFYVEVIRHWHTLPQNKATDVMLQHFFDLGQQLLLKHQQRLALSNLNTKLFVIINSTMYTMMRYIGLRPSLMTQHEIENELTLMISSYLQIKVDI